MSPTPMPPEPPDPNDPRNQDPGKVITWIRIGVVIVILLGGIAIWQLNHGPDVPSTSPSPAPSGSVAAAQSDEPGTFTVVFDGTSTFDREDPKAFASSVHSTVTWHVVFPSAPQNASADMGLSTVAGAGGVTWQDNNPAPCSSTNFRFVNQPIMVNPSANRWGTGYGITIPAVVDNTNGPNSTEVCPAYDASLPPGAPYSWLVASFPMQRGSYDVSGAPIHYTADTETLDMKWSGTVTVTPGG